MRRGAKESRADGRSGTPEGDLSARRAEQRRGLIVIFAGVVMVSIDGAIIRWLDSDPWSVIALRSPATAVGLWVAASMIDRRSLISQLRAAGRWGPLVTASSVGANLFWVYALSHTAVANVLAIYAGVPLFIALLGWIVIGERLAGPTWLGAGHRDDLGARARRFRLRGRGRCR